MKQVFKLKNGEILFEDERIVISDNAKTQYWVLIFITASGAFIGIVSVLNYVEIGQSFLLWAGLFIAVINSLVLLWMLFMTNRNEINKSDIRSIKLKRRLGNKFLDIRACLNFHDCAKAGKFCSEQDIFYSRMRAIRRKI